ncbi:MAG: response regulator [Leptolyngbya sp. Prado105]|jgi:CheY-like chemotaxis protein|nr:response regulator [Leptolyngbya sp. Prado105]
MTSHRILLIDDEIDIRMVVKATLELVGGMQVSVATSGEEGIKKAESEQPDAILLDMMLPDMDGSKTLENLQQNSKTCQIPVIFLTAKTQIAEQHYSSHVGAIAVITKPFDPALLSDQVATALGWSLSPT